mgnify:FL=1
MAVELKNTLKRYQLQWKPSFSAQKTIILGENTEYLNESNQRVGTDPNFFSLSTIINSAYDSRLVLPFNTSVALAEEYTPQIKNKVVKYETLGGNSITTFGQAIRQVGLKIKIIKAGRHWEIYEKGLEAMSYLSGNQTRFYGSLYLLCYDLFADGTEDLASRYKVVINRLAFSHRSSENTVLSASLLMSVLHDYGHYSSQKRRKWGSL